MGNNPIFLSFVLFTRIILKISYLIRIILGVGSITFMILLSLSINIPTFLLYFMLIRQFMYSLYLWSKTTNFLFLMFWLRKMGLSAPLKCSTKILLSVCLLILTPIIMIKRKFRLFLFIYIVLSNCVIPTSVYLFLVNFEIIENRINKYLLRLKIILQKFILSLGCLDLH